MRRRELRTLTDEEREKLTRLSRSQTAAHRLVRRATMILMVAEGTHFDAIGATVQCSADRVSQWVQRFNEAGLQGLEDKPRPGRDRLYSQQERGQIIAIARIHPDQLERDFGRWTLTRLTEYVNNELHITISRAQLGRVLDAEGLRWYQEKTYFTERPDPQFAEKRGR
jgi:transposase